MFEKLACLWHVGTPSETLARRMARWQTRSWHTSGKLARKPQWHASTLAGRPRWHAGTHNTRFSKLFEIQYLTIMKLVCFEKFLNIFTHYLDNHAPIKKLSRKEKSLNDKPWIDNYLGQLMSALWNTLELKNTYGLS